METPAGDAGGEGREVLGAATMIDTGYGGYGVGWGGKGGSWMGGVTACRVDTCAWGQDELKYLPTRRKTVGLGRKCIQNLETLLPRLFLRLLLQPPLHVRTITFLSISKTP